MKEAASITRLALHTSLNDSSLSFDRIISAAEGSGQSPRQREDRNHNGGNLVAKCTSTKPSQVQFNQIQPREIHRPAGPRHGQGSACVATDRKRCISTLRQQKTRSLDSAAAYPCPLAPYPSHASVCSSRFFLKCGQSSA